MQKLLKEILSEKKSVNVIIDALKAYENLQRYEAKFNRDSVQWNNINVDEANQLADEIERNCNHIEYIHEEFLEYEKSLEDKVEH
tara:strand:+ start:267 stop:521 length:255 start_codon:yes stop_codon:yes gene_type:complete